MTGDRIERAICSAVDLACDGEYMNQEVSNFLSALVCALAGEDIDNYDNKFDRELTAKINDIIKAHGIKITVE